MLSKILHISSYPIMFFSCLSGIIGLCGFFLSHNDWHGFLCSFFIGFGVGGFLFFSIKKNDKLIEINEGVFISIFCWFILIVIGALPFYFSPQTNVSFCTAILESTSMISTTGIKIINDLDNNAMLSFWRGILQLIGGIGVVAINGVFVMGYLRHGMSNVLKVEFQGSESFSVAKITKIIVSCYMCSFTICTCFCFKNNVSFFDSVLLAMSIVSTGGSVPDRVYEFIYFADEIKAIGIFFMLTMSLPIITMASLFFKKISLIQNIKYIFYFIFIICLFYSLIDNTGVLEASKMTLIDFVFNIVSIFTTTGFSPIDEVIFFASTKKYFTLLISMLLIGGVSGSTTGGIKVNRIFEFFKTIFSKLSSNRVGNFSSSDVFLILHICLFFLTILLFMIVLSSVCNISLEKVYYWSCQFISNSGMTGDGFNFHADILNNFKINKDIGSILLSVFFVIGRIEVFMFYRFLFYVLRLF